MPVDLVKNNRGVAIIITLTVIALILTVAFELNRKAGASVEFAGVTRDKVALSYMTSSGIHMGMALLSKDRNEAGNTQSDSLQEDWADPEIIAEALQDIPFEEGKLAVAISDELGRIQINALLKYPGGREVAPVQERMWDRFLGYLNLINPTENADDDASPTAIINSVRDWLDFGDDDAITGVTGAESDYYQDLDTPYSCRNGPMAHIEELLLVKGVPDLVANAGGFDVFAGLITVHGMIPDAGGKKFTFPGKININTADLYVLAAMLPQEEAYLAQEIITYREEMIDGNYTHTDLSKPTWYKNANGLEDVTIEEGLITTSSDFFRITAIAELNKVTSSAIAIIYRQKVKKTGKYVCKVLSWETE